MPEPRKLAKPEALKLVLYPDPVLRRRAPALLRIDEDVRARARRMFEVLYEERGVGLAAPQVGWSVRLFVVNTTGEPDPAEEAVYLNPEILSAEGAVVDEEGCLSIPGVKGKVERKARVVVRAQGLDGAVFEETAEDLRARVIQHELDHLDGILFVQRLGASDKLLAGKVLKELEREYREKHEEGP